MAFNPDEYLKEDFNPDAYLSDFNPDEYLSETPAQPMKRDVSLEDSLNDFSNKPFLERAVIAPLDIAGGVLETAATAIPMLATGVEHGARQLYGKAVKGLSGEDLHKYASDSWVQQNIAPELAPETITGKAIAKGFEKAVMDLPMNVYGAGKAALAGTGQTGAKDIIQAEGAGIKEWSDPLLEIGMGVAGAHGLYKALKQPAAPMEKAVDTLYEKETISSPEEGKMLEFVKQDIDAKIKEIQDAATVLGEKGDWSKQNVDILAALDKRMEELVKSQTKVESILNGDITNTVKAQKGVDLDIRVQEKVAELKAKRGPRPPYDPIVKETDIARVDEALAREPIPESIIPERNAGFAEEQPIVKQEMLPEVVEEIQATLPEGRLLTTVKEPVEALRTPKEQITYLIDEVKGLLDGFIEQGPFGERLINTADGPFETAQYLDYIAEKLRSIRDDKTVSARQVDYLEGMLVRSYRAFEHTYNKHVMDVLESPEFLPKIAEEITATLPKHPDMVSLLSDVETPLIEGLRSNEQLMNRVGNTRLDSRLSTPLQKIVKHFIDVAGLGKDEIFVVGMDEASLQSMGATSHSGNSSIIKLNLDKINQMAQSADTAGVSFGNMVGQKLANAKNTFAQVRVAAHEIGHILFNKYMQNFITDGAMYTDLLRKWDTYKKTSKFENVSLFDFDGGKRSASLVERQKYFHEFFAEQVTKELIHKHTLGAFVKGSKIFEPLIQASRDILKKVGIDVDNKTFATTIIQDIIAKNEESIKATGETIFERQERLNADQALTGQAPLFSQKTLQEITKHSRDSGFLPSKGRTSEALMALDVKDLPVISSRMIHALGKGSGFLARKFFGKIAVKEMQMKEGAVQDAYWKIRKAEEYSEAVVNRLWNGDVKPSNVGFTDVLSKVKASDSVFVTLTKATYNDLATLHDVFNKGLQEGLEYADNLKQNGQHLTPEQVKYYNSIADLYTKMYDESAKLQQDLGKKWVLPKKAGWFQSVRSGNYAVTISFGDIMAHRQHFQTQLQAEKFLQKLKESGLKHLEVSEVIDTRKQPAQSNKQMADIIRDALSKDFPHGKEAFEDRINSILDSMNVRGGKLGQHHKYRFNVPGYKGTEFFKSKEELGKSFKEAIEYAIAEKGNQLKQMQIDHQLKTLLEEGTLKTEKPESYAAIQQMYDSTLGRNEALFDGSKIDYTADKVLDSVYNVFGKEYAVDRSAARSVYEGIKESFYLTKMMPKMMFSIIGQVLSVPPGTISHLSYGGHGARAYLSFAKGLTKLSLGDKTLWKAIKEDSQQYNVFEPAFIEAMSLQDASKPVYKALKDYVLMQAPGKAMDSVSRVMTYAIAKTHFTDLGMSEKAAREQARFATGKILNLYDKANAAPVFSHLGGIGDVVQPLMGFGQNALGSLIAAVKHVSPKDYRTWGPLVNYTLVTIATSGIMGMQFIQEYEQFRRYINKNFNDFTLPSILDIFASDDGFLNRLTPLSEQERQTVMYGMPSLSGLDLASSVRANETFPTLIAGLVGGWTQPNETMAMLSWGASVPGAMVDIGQAVSGNKSLADTRKAFDVIAPAGHLGYAAKKAIGLENTNVLGGTTDMLAGGSKATAYAKEQPIDVAAGIMGGKTTQRRWEEQRDFETAEKEQNLSAKKDRAGVLYVETGNPKFIDKMVELGMTEKQIVSKIELELHNRLTPQEIRLIANKAGKVVKGSGERKAIQLFKFGQKE